MGTLRDVTAEHYAIQRERALAALGQVLARASSMADTLRKRSPSCTGSGTPTVSSPPYGGTRQRRP